MAAPRKYGDEIRQDIHELVNEQGRPATDAAQILAHTYPEVPEIRRLREIAREERAARRPDLTTQPKAEQLQSLIAGIVKAVDTALQAANDDPTTIDAGHLLKLAQTVKEIEPLLKPEPQKNGQDQAPKGLLGQLGGAQPRRTRNQEPTHTDAVRSRVAGVDAVNMGAEVA